MLYRRTHTLSTCWKIKRVDGTTFYFTDHPFKLILDDTNTYTPLGAGDFSARRKDTGLEDANSEYRGIITSDAITYNDLYSGKYKDAQITEMLVDWRYAWAGSLCTSNYWITSLEYTGEDWIAQIGGLTTWFNQAIGRLFDRNCDATLGDSRCKINLPSLSTTGDIATITTQRVSFTWTSSVVAPFTTTEYCTLGKILWTGGNNTGLVSEIRTYAYLGIPGAAIGLFLETPFDFQVGDMFQVTPGCDKLMTTCRDKFNNVVNHRGHPTIPGTDKTLTSPQT